MPRSPECEAWLCENCKDDDCDHFCHQSSEKDKKVIAPI